MSRFLSAAMAAMAPYVPGEQPQDKAYIKLNTNECPYPPSPLVQKALEEGWREKLSLYPDPEVLALRRAMGEYCGLDVGRVFAGGGSDEVLGYAFMAFFDRGDKVYFPNVTYGFYQVYAQLCGLEAVQLPLREDFTINPADYRGLDGHIFLANPNAPTGIALARAEIEEILKGNPDRLVVVDEAYADFAEDVSCVGLIPQYDNLLVVQTFSKSRALAGQRIGFGFGQEPLIDALDRVKFSFNPYNMDHISIGVGIAAIQDRAYLARTVEKIRETRERTARELKALGFAVLPSSTNFLFAGAPGLGGGELYAGLKEKGVLVRHFSKPVTARFVRITIGTDEEMDTLLKAVRELLRQDG